MIRNKSLVNSLIDNGVFIFVRSSFADARSLIVLSRIAVKKSL